MKRVFRFKKGEITDWDEPIIHFIENHLMDTVSPGDFPTWKKNWKFTMIIEEENYANTRKVKERRKEQNIKRAL